MLKGKKILFTGVGQVETVQTVQTDFDEPSELFREDLWLKTEYTLISPGTELDCLMNRTTVKSLPKCLGYSAVCRVLKRGAEADSFAEGDRVLVYHSCHAAYHLKNKEDVVKVPDGLDPVQAIFAVVGCMGLQGVRKLLIVSRLF